MLVLHSILLLHSIYRRNLLPFFMLQRPQLPPKKFQPIGIDDRQITKAVTPHT